jgi:hypothetical protein
MVNCLSRANSINLTFIISPPLVSIIYEDAKYGTDHMTNTWEEICNERLKTDSNVLCTELCCGVVQVQNSYWRTTVCVFLQAPNLSATFLPEENIQISSFKTQSRTGSTTENWLTEDSAFYCKNQIQLHFLTFPWISLYHNLVSHKLSIYLSNMP